MFRIKSELANLPLIIQIWVVGIIVLGIAAMTSMIAAIVHYIK
jgi:hypothetical protein